MKGIAPFVREAAKDIAAGRGRGFSGKRPPERISVRDAKTTIRQILRGPDAGCRRNPARLATHMGRGGDLEKTGRQGCGRGESFVVWSRICDRPVAGGEERKNREDYRVARGAGASAEGWGRTGRVYRSIGEAYRGRVVAMEAEEARKCAGCGQAGPLRDGSFCSTACRQRARRARRRARRRPDLRQLQARIRPEPEGCAVLFGRLPVSRLSAAVGG